MLQQAADLLIEVSPAAVLRAPKEESLPRRYHLVAELPLLVSFPWGFCFLFPRTANGIFLISTLSWLCTPRHALLTSRLEPQSTTLCHGVQSGCFLQLTADLTTLYRAVIPDTQTGISVHVSGLPPCAGPVSSSSFSSDSLTRAPVRRSPSL